jgi:hypothetical protein
VLEKATLKVLRTNVVSMFAHDLLRAAHVPATTGPGLAPAAVALRETERRGQQAEAKN